MKLPALCYIINDDCIQNLLYLKEDNAFLFRPYLKDLQSLQKLIQNPLISKEEKIISLAYLCRISSKKHNAFLLSLDKQEAFYKILNKQQVFLHYMKKQILMF